MTNVEVADPDPRDYPFARHPGDWVLRGAAGARRAHPLAPQEAAALLDGCAAAGRTAVLAIGANAAPSRLAAKFPDVGEGEIPVLAVDLVDHDVVFAARMSGYGAVPATTVRSPGTVAHVHVTLLTDAQRAAVDRSEGLGVAYTREVLPPYAVVRRGERLPGPVHAYVAVAGALAFDDVGGARCPRALAAVAATGRKLAEATEAEVLSIVAATLGRTVDDLLAPVRGPDTAAHLAEVRAHLAARAVAAHSTDAPRRSTLGDPAALDEDGRLPVPTPSSTPATS